jgi:hypothetical protein
MNEGTNMNDQSCTNPDYVDGPIDGLSDAWRWVSVEPFEALGESQLEGLRLEFRVKGDDRDEVYAVASRLEVEL